ncbi:hypothetical protein [Deinococcus hopiensis]|nr:hypothetical protein [Deinococcus hopiensis]
MKLLSALLLGLPGLALAAPVHSEMQSYANVNGRVQPVFAWCDAPDRVLAVTQPTKVAMTPQPVTLLTWPKAKTGQLQRASWQLGPNDAGAGNVYVALTPAGQMAAQTPASYVHLSNVQNVNDPAYRMTKVGPFKLGNRIYDCRYEPQATFVGTTANRTVTVWDSGKRTTYGTQNFNGTRGVLLRGDQTAYGATTRESSRVTGFQRVYLWTTPDGYTYRVEMTESGASVTVLKNGKVLRREPFLAYSVSLPAKEQP